jgi:hypothetical protein
LDLLAKNTQEHFNEAGELQPQRPREEQGRRQELPDNPQVGLRLAKHKKSATSTNPKASKFHKSKKAGKVELSKSSKLSGFGNCFGCGKPAG